jgi:hypothetical protein
MDDVFGITQRERFLLYMSFQDTDRVPLMEMGVWDETLVRWHCEGLPKWVTHLRHLEDFLGLDRSFNVNWLPIDNELYPPFEPKVIEEDEETITIRDESGTVLRQKKSHKTIPHYISFPVESAADYEKLSSRLNGAAPGRYAEYFDDDLRWRIERGEIIGINFRSFFGHPRKLMGFEKWCTAFYDDSDLVLRVIEDRVRFAGDLFARVLSTGKVDFVQVWEDMAFNTAPMISPEFVKRYMAPAYEQVVELFRNAGVSLIMVDCDGRVRDLLPIWLEAGMDGCHPCEIAAGSDPLVLRRRFPGCRLMGGLDKRKIASGREGIDGELERIRPVLDQGGYIPMLDHFVPPDVSYDDYRYYLDRRRKLFER